MRSITVLPLLLLLPACWASKGSFYTPDPRAAAPFEPGRYADPKSPGDVVGLTRLPDGRYRVAQDGKQTLDSPVTFQPVALPGRKIWIMQVPFDLGVPTAVYELVERRADGAVSIAELNCPGNEAITKAAGGSVTSDKDFNNGRPSCTFASRASLEKAVAAYVKAHPTLPSSQTMRRIGG